MRQSSAIILLATLFLTTFAVGCGEDRANTIEENVDLASSEEDVEATPVTEEPNPTPAASEDSTEDAPAAGKVPPPGSSVSDGETLYISWIMDPAVENATTGVPESRLRLSINGNAFVVMPKTVGRHEEIKKSEFGTYKIPAEAMGAVKSWYAGAGDIVYAIRSGNSIRVMRAETDEESGQGEFTEIAMQPIR